MAAFPCVLTGQSTVSPTDSSAHRPSQRQHRQVVWRDSATAHVYTRPPAFHAITDVPGALGASVKEAFRAPYIPIVLAVAASTVVLIAADESVLDESRRMARRVGLPRNHPSADVRIGAFKLAFPTTVGSGLYFLGDGLTSVAVAAGFATRATVADDLRARRVASEVIEALLASGTVTQLLKHVAGRQTPSEATVPRGRWRPFPPLGAYNRNVPAYDAFPSGHLASTMATITVCRAELSRAPLHLACWLRDHGGAVVRDGQQRGALGKRLPVGAGHWWRGGKSRGGPRPHRGALAGSGCDGSDHDEHCIARRRRAGARARGHRCSGSLLDAASAGVRTVRERSCSVSEPNFRCDVICSNT